MNHLLALTDEIICPPIEEKDRRYRHLVIDKNDRAMPFLAKIVFELDDSRIVQTKAQFGTTYRGIEQRLTQVPWQTAISEVAQLNPRLPEPLRIAMQDSLEHLLGIENEVSMGTQLWRSIRLETTRVIHHLSLLPHHKLLDVAIALSLVPPSDVAQIKHLAEFLLAHFQTLRQSMIAHRRLRNRLAGRGKISKETALSYGITGPALRACGIPDDCRHGIEIPTEKEGDAWARLKVKTAEVILSIEFILKVLPMLKSETPTDTLLSPSLKVPTGQYTAFVEAPEGELRVTLVSNGEDKPYRVHIRTPSFALANAIPEFLKNADIGDAPAILAGLGIVSYEVDR